MGRRAFREKRSKFSGTKQVLQNLNQAAHSIVHDLDVSLPAGGASGYVLFWNSNVYMHDGDISGPIYAPEDGTIEAVYASLPQAAVGDFTVQVYLQGSPIFTTLANRPTVTTGNYLSADEVPDVTTVLARDAFEVEVVSTGGSYGRAIVYIVIT